MAASGKNRFGFDTVDDIPVGKAKRRRGTGPMSAAVRETAETVRESTESMVEARRQNAADAREFREAMTDGRVLSRVPLEDIRTDDLPRDRLDLEGVARSDEMDELKASIRVHGQKEPIELYRDGQGALQLKKGWRRLTALGALQAETGEDSFATALARIDTAAPDRLRHYIDMVEETILREDLTFAEMAQLAIEAACDPAIEGKTAKDVVARLYSSLHKTKRSYINAFVFLLELLGEDLQFPKAVGRDVGVDLARVLRENPGAVGPLKRELMACEDADGQGMVLRAAIERRGAVAPKPAQADTRQKYEFHVGTAKVTARKGEFRIKDVTDFTEVPRNRLENAVAAFQAALRKE